jgi:hypothetical protein
VWQSYHIVGVTNMVAKQKVSRQTGGEGVNKVLTR